MNTLKKYTRSNSEIIIDFNPLIEIVTSSIPLRVSSSSDERIHMYIEGEGIETDSIFRVSSDKDSVIIYDFSYSLNREKRGSLILNVEIPKRNYIEPMNVFIRRKDISDRPKCDINLSSNLDELFIEGDMPVSIVGTIPRVVSINGGLNNIEIYGDLSSDHTFFNLETHTGDISVNICGTKKYNCRTSYVYHNENSKKENTLDKDDFYEMAVYGSIRTNSGAIILT